MTDVIGARVIARYPGGDWRAATVRGLVVTGDLAHLRPHSWAHVRKAILVFDGETLERMVPTGGIECGTPLDAIQWDTRPLTVTPGFYEKYHRPGDGLVRGRYA